MFYMIFPKPLEEIKEKLDKYNHSYEVLVDEEPVLIRKAAESKKNSKFEIYSSVYFCTMLYKGPLYVYLVNDKFYYKNFVIGQKGYLSIRRQPLLKQVNDLDAKRLSYQHLLLPMEERVLQGDVDYLKSGVYSFLEDSNLSQNPILGFVLNENFKYLSEKECEKLKNLFCGR